LVKVGAKVLCRFEEITALEVVTGNVNVGGLPTIIVGQVQRGYIEKLFPRFTCSFTYRWKSIL